MRWGRKAKGTGATRVDIPIYLDSGVALSLSASLGHGLVLERSFEKATAKGAEGDARARAGIGGVLSFEGRSGGARSVAVTENEVRKQTEESIFNSVRSALETNDLLKTPSHPWVGAEWREGEFVDFTAGRLVVPLVSVLGRVRVIAESFSFATTVLSAESLQARIPQILEHLRASMDTDDEDTTVFGSDTGIDAILAIITEVGQLADALAGVIERIEKEAESSGLIDVVMFESQSEGPGIVAVASLDRDYVNTKSLRRLGQGHFGVLGKVIRAPAPGTALNLFRNSMLGATNQLPVRLHALTEQLLKLPTWLGDAVQVDEDEEGNPIFLDFVGSTSAFAELFPLWMGPSVEIFPVAIYA